MSGEWRLQGLVDLTDVGMVFILFYFFNFNLDFVWIWDVNHMMLDG